MILQLLADTAECNQQLTTAECNQQLTTVKTSQLEDKYLSWVNIIRDYV